LKIARLKNDTNNEISQYRLVYRQKYRPPLGVTVDKSY